MSMFKDEKTKDIIKKSYTEIRDCIEMITIGRKALMLAGETEESINQFIVDVSQNEFNRVDAMSEQEFAVHVLKTQLKQLLRLGIIEKGFANEN